MGNSCPEIHASGQCGLYGEFSFTTGVLNAEVRVRDFEISTVVSMSQAHDSHDQGGLPYSAHLVDLTCRSYIVPVPGVSILPRKQECPAAVHLPPRLALRIRQTHIFCEEEDKHFQDEARREGGQKMWLRLESLVSEYYAEDLTEAIVRQERKGQRH